MRIGMYGFVPRPAHTLNHIRSSHSCSQRARCTSIPQLVTTAGPNGMRT
jgi:hypothetical protein